MKRKTIFTSLIALGFCALLPSCGLLQSAARLPGSILKTVGRTVGMPVKHVEEPSNQTAQPMIQTDEGEILPLD